MAVVLDSLFLSLVFPSKTSAGNFCEHSLEQRIAEIIDQPHLQRTRWGIDIQTVSAAGATISPQLTHNANQLFLPASTAKLFTATALVKAFEPTYQIETAYIGHGTAPNLQQLRVLGQGDPSILDPQLMQLAQDLKSQGIRRIETLVGEDEQFGSPWIVPSWEWEDLHTSDGVPITSLSFSQNSLPLRLSPSEVGQPLSFEWLDGKPLLPLIIENFSTTVAADQPEYIRLGRNLAGTTLTISGQLRVGADPDTSYVAIAYPTQYFLFRLKQALQSEGIQVKNISVGLASGSFNPKDDTEGKTLGSLKSPPLTDILKAINQSSNNFYAESLLRHLAGVTSSKPSITSDFSIKTLKALLQSEGVNSDSYFLKDASGLSRQNLVSPESLTTTLKAVLKWKGTENADKFQTLKNSLAIAGQAGTLKRRFQDSPVAGKLFAKTGTLNGTVTLAGFLEGADRSTSVLTLMANQSDQPIAVLRNAIDEIVLQIAQAQSCPEVSAERPTNLKKSLYNHKSEDH